MTEPVNVYSFGVRPRIKPKAKAVKKAVLAVVPAIVEPEPEEIVEVKVRRRRAAVRAEIAEPEKKLRSHHKAKEPDEPKKKAKKKGA